MLVLGAPESRGLTRKPKMKNQICSSDEDDYDSCNLASYSWWRSAAKFDECAKLKFDPPNISGLTPRLRVLRELERLALVAHEGLNELRHKLLMYCSGDFWMPTGGISKEKMDIPPVITILLVGFSGSGKSSLVNLMYSVLGRSGLVPFAQTSSGELLITFLLHKKMLQRIHNPQCKLVFYFFYLVSLL